MSHTFDTGANRPMRTLVEQGAVTILAPLRRVVGGYLNAVFAFGGIVRTYTDEDGIESLVKQFAPMPCIAVSSATRDARSANVQKTANISQMQLFLYFANQNSSGAQVGRMEIDHLGLADNLADPGLHIMMEHALELMLGQYPTGQTTQVKQLEFTKEEELVTSEAISIWRQTYVLTMNQLIPRTGGGQFRTAPQLLESIRWRLTTDPTEVLPPDPAEAPTSIDVNNDDLDPP